MVVALLHWLDGLPQRSLRTLVLFLVLALGVLDVTLWRRIQALEQEQAILLLRIQLLERYTPRP